MISFTLGILASKLSKIMEERIVVMAGAVLATIGVFFSAFVTNFYVFVLLLGGLAGIQFILKVRKLFKHLLKF